jgi:hypothetical protein
MFHIISSLQALQTTSLILPTCTTCPDYLILLDMITLTTFEKKTNYGAPYYAVFSSLLSFHPSQVQIFS